MIMDPSGLDVKVLTDQSLFDKATVIDAQKFFDNRNNDTMKGGTLDRDAPAPDKGAPYKGKVNYIGDKVAYEKFRVQQTSLPDSQEDSMKAIIDTLKNATEKDHIVIQAHAAQDVVTHKSYGLVIGSKDIDFEDFVKALGQAKGTKAASITLQACAVPKDQAAAMKKALGVKDLYYSDVDQKISSYSLGLAGRTESKEVPGTFKKDDKNRTYTETRTTDFSKVEYDPVKHVQWDDEQGVRHSMKKAE
jgi:hypothetical protein